MGRIAVLFAGFWMGLAGLSVGAGDPLDPNRVIAKSDWDDGTRQGWSLGSDATGAYNLATSGGNPGGHVFFNDTGSIGQPALLAPAAFLGDYLLFEGACFVWDDKALSAAQSAGVLFRLTGPGGEIAYRHVEPVAPNWFTHILPLDQIRKTVTEALWESVICNVTQLEVNLDVFDGLGLDGALDNFKIVAGGKGVLIDFDDVERAEGLFSLPTDQYRDRGAVFSQDLQIENVPRLEPQWVAIAQSGGASLPNGLYLGPPAGQTSMDITFVVPGTTAPAVTDYVRINVFDANIGTNLGTLEALDVDGNSIQRISLTTSPTNSARYEIHAPDIARITLSQDSDSGIFDNLFFHTPVSRGNQVPGDCNQDSRIDISDAVCVFRTLFSPPPLRFPCGDGTAAHPANLALSDWDGNGQLSIGDGIAVLHFLFQAGPSHPLTVPGEEKSACVQIDGCPTSPGVNCKAAPSSSRIVFYVTGKPGESPWYTGPEMVEPLRKSVESRGFAVDVKDNALAPAITPSILASASQLWILEGDRDDTKDLSMSTDEIRNFLNRGGNIWVSTEGSDGITDWFEDTLEFLESLGVGVGRQLITGPASPVLSPVPDHPLFRGVDQLHFDGGIGPELLLANVNSDFRVSFKWEYKGDAGVIVPGIVLLDGRAKGKGQLLIDTGWLLGYAYCDGTCPDKRQQPAGSDDRRFAGNVAEFFGNR